jgi:peptidoglycan/xylan/chitin deacetylase (PgdA/CDA1 family)
MSIDIGSSPFRSGILVVTLFLSTFVPAGCAEEEARPDEGTSSASTAVDACAYPEIPVEPRETKPAWLPRNDFALTFDDGPDLVNTPKVLDTLKAEGIHAAFFINTNTDQGLVNANDARTRAEARAVLRRIVDEGHELGNHTMHHEHLPQLSPAEIEAELAGVERVVAEVLGPRAPRMTLVRAPYGEPYWFEPGDPSIPKVTSIIRAHGVHVGWAIDTKDYKCPKDAPACVVRSLVRRLDDGDYGVVLLHSVHPQSAAALPQIIAELRRRGARFVSVEDVVRARYGKSSAELVENPGACPRGGGGGAH